jgi:hypothetical protein
MAEPSQSASEGRTRFDSIRILKLAEGQWGLVTRAQLKRNGFGDATVSRWVRTGRLQRLYPRVYVVGHRVLTTEGRLVAALLYAGPDAALSHASAANWWGLLSHLPRSIHVSAPQRRRSVPGVYVHRTRRIERVRHRDLPVTPVARTLLDFASAAPPHGLRRAIAEADYLRLLSLEEIDAVLGRGRPGSAALRRALQRHRPQYARTLSPLEDRLLDLCRSHGIPLPEVNVTVAGFKVDALWRNQRVIVEVDGHAAHDSGTAMERDRDRDLGLRAAGYDVLRYTWRQVVQRSDDVAADLSSALHL